MTNRPENTKIRLYNSLTKQIESIKPLEGDSFRIYSCGPTVYDFAHIGNLSSYVYVDTLKRSLRLAGYNIYHVMNFTDVDDKTISRSQMLYPKLKSNFALTKLTRQYETHFLNDLRNINIQTEDTKFVRATESIPEMQFLISILFETGFAYISEDGVYFSIDAYKKSGKTYGQLIKLATNKTQKQRISSDEYAKDSINDFALWKVSKKNEPSWSFKLAGKDLSGRPGWHIECSAMSASNLGQPFDIHTGGVDLIFPHHENEIAQSTAGKAEPLYAKTFCHSEHLLVDGKKMSKSLNNFYTLNDISKKGLTFDAFRLFILQAHYRTQTNFTWQNLRSAEIRLSKWLEFADSYWQISQSKKDISSKLITLINNDLNTPVVLAYIDEYFTTLETEHKSPNLKTLKTIDNLLGINLIRPDISQVQKQLINARFMARKKENWQKSDEIRDQLKDQGIILRDTDSATYWNRPLL